MQTALVQFLFSIFVILSGHLKEKVYSKEVPINSFIKLALETMKFGSFLISTYPLHKLSWSLPKLGRTFLSLDLLCPWESSSGKDLFKVSVFCDYSEMAWPSGWGVWAMRYPNTLLTDWLFPDSHGCVSLYTFICTPSAWVSSPHIFTLQLQVMSFTSEMT